MLSAKRNLAPKIACRTLKVRAHSVRRSRLALPHRNISTSPENMQALPSEASVHGLELDALSVPAAHSMNESPRALTRSEAAVHVTENDPVVCRAYLEQTGQLTTNVSEDGVEDAAVLATHGNNSGGEASRCLSVRVLARRESFSCSVNNVRRLSAREQVLECSSAKTTISVAGSPAVSMPSHPSPAADVEAVTEGVWRHFSAHSPSAALVTSPGASSHGLFGSIDPFTALWMVVGALALSVEVFKAIARGVKWCFSGQGISTVVSVCQTLVPQKLQVWLVYLIFISSSHVAPPLQNPASPTYMSMCGKIKRESEGDIPSQLLDVTSVQLPSVHPISSKMSISSQRE